MRLVVTTLLAAMLCAPIAVLAQEEKAGSVQDTLAKNKGKRVSLRFSAGEELTGKVAALSDQTVHLTELAGRDFFDAIVELDDVVAVVFRAREK